MQHDAAVPARSQQGFGTLSAVAGRVSVRTRPTTRTGDSLTNQGPWPGAQDRTIRSNLWGSSAWSRWAGRETVTVHPVRVVRSSRSTCKADGFVSQTEQLGAGPDPEHRGILVEHEIDYLDVRPAV